MLNQINLNEILHKNINQRITANSQVFDYFMPEYKTFFVDSGDVFCNEIADVPQEQKLSFILSNTKGPKCVVQVEEDFLQNYEDLQSCTKPFKDIVSLDTWNDDCFFVSNNRSIYKEVSKFAKIIYMPGLFDLVSYIDAPNQYTSNYNSTCHTSYVYSNDRYGIRQPIVNFLWLNHSKCTTIIANEHTDTIEYYNPNVELSKEQRRKFTDFDLLAGWGSHTVENDFYRNDVFGLSLETIGIDWTDTVITEKTYKFYALGKPVLVYSKARNIRDTIIDLGFDPCDWLFDYSFDNSTNKEEEFIKELKRLFAISIDKLVALCKQNEQSLVNNFNRRINLINNYSKQITW